MSVVAAGQTISTLYCVIWSIKLLFPEMRRFINELRIQIQDWIPLNNGFGREWQKIAYIVLFSTKHRR
jgi:hypothetical protein